MYQYVEWGFEEYTCYIVNMYYWALSHTQECILDDTTRQKATLLSDNLKKYIPKWSFTGVNCTK